MASRTYYNRQNFQDGWDARTGRYEKPGTLKDMDDTMLDIYERGAVRQVWGGHPAVVSPFVANTLSEWQIDYNTGEKFPGVCLLDRIKFGAKDGDTIVYGVNFKLGSTVTTRFYHLNPPADDNAHQFSQPFGSTFSIAVPPSDYYYLGGLAMGYMVGRDPQDPSFTMSTLAVHNGSILFSAVGAWMRYQAPAVIGTGKDTLSIKVTDDISGSSVSLTVLVDLKAAATISSGKNQYWFAGGMTHHSAFSGGIQEGRQAFHDLSLYTFHGGVNDELLCPNFYNGSPTSISVANTFSGLSFSGTIASGDQPSLKTVRAGTLDDVVSYTGTYNSDPVTYNIFTPRTIHGQPGVGTNQTKPASPRNQIHEVVDPLTATTNTPYGCWRVVTMNNNAYFYNGFSGSHFGCEQDTPSNTFTIGLTRPVLTTISVQENTSADTASRNVKGIVRYYIAELDEDDNEGPLSEWFPGAGSALQTGLIKGSAAAAGGWNAGTGTAVSISNIPVHAVSKKIRLYRTMAERHQPYLLEDLEAAGTFTTVDYSDEKLDVQLGDLPWTHGDPPPDDFFSPVVYYDRVWGLGTRPGVTREDQDGNTYTVLHRRTTLFWSDINQPESFWWDGNWANVYADDGDFVTCLLRDPTGLLVFKNNHMYRITGRIPEDIGFIEVTAADSGVGVGTPNPHSAIATEYGSFFYFQGGVYIYGSGQARKISDPISPYLEDFGASVFATQFPNDDEVTLSYDPFHKILFFSIELPVTRATFLFDVENARWIGRYSSAINFIRRLNMEMWGRWDIAAQSSVVTGLFGVVNNYLDPRNSFSSPGTIVIFDPQSSLWCNYKATPSFTCHPLIGNLGPYDSKRFLWVDHLADADSAYWPSGIGGVNYLADTGSILSSVALDGTTSTNSDTLSIDGGAIYGDRMRHVFGGVGAELSLEVELDVLNTGEIHKIYEYAYAWQPMSKHGVGSGGIGGGGFQF
jgi:hypothetical protein